VLVSDSRKLVFIHVQKIGGSTVSRLLKENVPDIYSAGARHEFAIQGMKKLEDWDYCFKFAFVRNPWDQLVSWYSMLIRA
jgi:chondroitin 4-sulfotransferase 11